MKWRFITFKTKPNHYNRSSAGTVQVSADAVICVDFDKGTAAFFGERENYELADLLTLRIGESFDEADPARLPSEVAE